MRTVADLDEPSRWIVSILLEELRRRFGANLRSLVLYGSRARGSHRDDSDVDVLVVVDGAPTSRMDRYAELRAPDDAARVRLRDRFGLAAPYLSYVIKNREQAEYHDPLYLDMTEDAVIVHDADGFFGRILDDMRQRMRALGSKRVFMGDRWYWVLKPGMKWGEVVEI